VKRRDFLKATGATGLFILFRASALAARPSKLEPSLWNRMPISLVAIIICVREWRYFD